MTSNLTIRSLTSQDIPAALRLSQQSGWNQRDADWQRFVAMQPDGCFLAESEGTLLGTACGCIFGSVAWVALVLVDAAHRQRGLGTALTRHVLAFLDAQHVPSIRLDATPLGRPIYEKLGFVAEYELARYAGVLPSSREAQPAAVGVATAHDLPDICRLDEQVTQADRRKFLARLCAEDPTALRLVRAESGLRGYAGSRPGARAVQIGPCLADDGTGPVLLADTFARHAGQNVYVDIPLSHTRAAAQAESSGLTVQRTLLRMRRGQRIAEDLDRLWASAGPEKG